MNTRTILAPLVALSVSATALGTDLAYRTPSATPYTWTGGQWISNDSNKTVQPAPPTLSDNVFVWSNNLKADTNDAGNPLCVAGGMLPVLYPYVGMAWVALGSGAEGPRIAADAFGGGDAAPEGWSPPSPRADQRNGVCRFRDRFLCTVKDGFVLLGPDGSATPWRHLGSEGHRGAPATDGRRVLLTDRSGRRQRCGISPIRIPRAFSPTTPSPATPTSAPSGGDMPSSPPGTRAC